MRRRNTARLQLTTFQYNSLLFNYVSSCNCISISNCNYANCLPPILTVHFQLNDLSNARANAIVRLAQVETFTILLDVLQQHGTVAEQLGERTFAHLLVFA